MLHHNPPVISTPTGGLADRIKNLIASIELAEKYDTNIVCYWTPDAHCNGHFLDHFAPIPQIEFKSGNYRGEIHQEVVVEQGAKTRIKHAWAISCDERHWCSRQSNIPTGPTKYHRLIKPSGETAKIIDSFAAQHDIENMPGLHVRRTDKLGTLNQPIPWCPEKDDRRLVSIIKKLDSRLFLATDNRQTQDMLVDRFGSQIVFYEMIEQNEGRRQTSLRHAVVDLFLLARCRELIQGQSVYSGFIHLAGNLHYAFRYPNPA